MRRHARWLLLLGLLNVGAATVLAGSATGAGLPAIERPPASVLAMGWRVAADEAEDDEFVTATAPNPAAWDGVYLGTIMARLDGRAATFRVTVKEGRGVGTQSRLDCGTAPVSLRISPVGEVVGVATMFGPTCLRSDVAVRGRAIAGTLQLRVGSQSLELVRP